MFLSFSALICDHSRSNFFDPSTFQVSSIRIAPEAEEIVAGRFGRGGGGRHDNKNGDENRHDKT